VIYTHIWLNLPRDDRHLLRLHKNSRKRNIDQDTYNRAIDLGLGTNKHAQYKKMITNWWCLIEISNMANCFLVFKYYLLTRVNRPVIKHLSAQGGPVSKGGLCYFWCPNKTWTLPLGASEPLTIIKKGLKWKSYSP
jgi:hypothetical protein